MTRPVKKRTAKSYARDVETLVRLRAAITLDDSADWALAQKAIKQIDATIEALKPLIEERAIKVSERQA